MLKQAQSSKHPDPEDVASHYVQRLLEGYHVKATVQQAYIDICRLSSGRKGMPGYEAKKRLNMLALTEEQNDYADLQPSLQHISIDDRLDLEKVLGKIKCDRTILIFRRYLEGYILKDIAHELGLTESRVNQIVNRTLQSLEVHT